VGSELELPLGLNASQESTPHGVPITERTATLRAVLDDLALIGDVADLGSGWWLPAPARVVAFGDGCALLLGGPPCASMPTAVRHALLDGSIARVVDIKPGTVAAALGHVPIQSDADWRRRPAGDVAEWAEQVLTATRVLPGALDEGSLDVYAPAVACARRLGDLRDGPRPITQYFRWLPLDQRIPDGRHLARVRTARGRHALVVEVQHGSVIASAAPVLYPGDVRRFCYGLDARDRCPTQVHVSPLTERRGVRFTCASALPGAELRLAVALGTLVPAREGTYYPQLWDMGGDVARTMATALTAIGVAFALPTDDAARAALAPILSSTAALELT
jgi:hypothetical protein